MSRGNLSSMVKTAEYDTILTNILIMLSLYLLTINTVCKWDPVPFTVY